MTTGPQERIRRIAREQLGYERLRPGQEEAIAALLAGHDVLAVLPSGGGKSAIYQLAALQMPGPALVVSPLLALQRDQVGAIEAAGVAQAAWLDSTLTADEREARLAAFEAGSLKFLFLAPEQLGNAEVMQRLVCAQPALIAVDEAHCISQWGYDFRPEYLRLGAAIDALGHPRVLGLTATASPPVRDEIVERLGMREPRVVVRGFDRPNIWLGVDRFDDEAAKSRALIERVLELETPGIVYAATHKHTEEIAGDLSERGVPALAYHAGMGSTERDAAQASFMHGEAAVIVATTAFGMGVDTPGVRFVLHADVSDSLDAYYQEIGRAGRDGAPAKARLFYRPSDLGIRRFFAGSGKVNGEQVEMVSDAIEQQDGPAAIEALREQTGLSEAKLQAALAGLEESGAVAIAATGEVEGGLAAVDVEQAAEEAERRRRVEQSRVEMMRGYAETHDCRRRYLLNYFGEPYDGPCGNCDNCDAGASAQASSLPYPLNSRVRHARLGAGSIVHYEGGKVTVLFDDSGYKTLDLDLVAEQGLLEPAE